MRLSAAWPFQSPTKARTHEQIEPSVREQIRAVLHGEAPWPLAFLGEAGGGKTCAALCVCDRAGYGAYATVPDLCRMVRDAMEGKLVSESGYAFDDHEVWRSWGQANIAVLDELGTREKASDFQYETVKRAIDLRLEWERPLIVVSNHSVGALTQCYDDRIASRVGSGTVIAFTGDRRFESVP